MAEKFWWTVELALAETGALAEENLSSFAALSGAVGSEVLERDDGLILRADYSGEEQPREIADKIKSLLAQESFAGLKLSACYRVDEQDWAKKCRDAFKPVKIGRSLAVLAPWLKDDLKVEDLEGRTPIFIYPAAAFGTGYHESTRIALELLESAVKHGDHVLDVGAGTGILFIAALKLGAAHAVARDIDPDAVGEMRRNLEMNNISSSACDVGVGNLLAKINVKVDILVANILLEQNLAMLPSASFVLKPRGVAIFSGMLFSERAMFLSMLGVAKLRVERELRIGEWWGCRARSR